VGIVLGVLGLVTTAVAGGLIVFVDDDGDVGDAAAEADVVVAPCGVDPGTGTVAATLTVTNSTATTSNYLITLTVAEAEGDTVGRAYATASQVGPGAVVQVAASSDVDQVAAPTCVVETVTRYPAPGAVEVSTSAPASTSVAPTSGG
jgi:hypothetical protein